MLIIIIVTDGRPNINKHYWRSKKPTLLNIAFLNAILILDVLFYYYNIVFARQSMII